MQIGIDVGGTHTDAVLLEDRRVLAEVKSPTTPEVTSGILAVAARVALGQRRGSRA